MNRPGRAVWPLVLSAACASGDRVEVAPSPSGELPDPAAAVTPSSASPEPFEATREGALHPVEAATPPVVDGFAADALGEVVASVRPQSMQAATLAVYRRTTGAWLWSDGRIPRPAAWALLERLKQAEDHGLVTALLNVRELERLSSALTWNLGLLEQTTPGTSEAASLSSVRALLLGELDTRLTAAALLLARQVGHTSASGEQLSEALPEVSELETWVADLFPWHPQYRRLVEVAMPRYRGFRDRRWPRLSLPDGVRHMGRGGRGPQVETLRKRLAAEGLLRSEPRDEPRRFDDDLVADLKRFQHTRGIKPHGLLNEETVRALNEMPRQLRRRIQRALAAWRRSHTRDEHTFVQVNVPEFSVEVYRDRERTHRRRAVVGYAFESGGGRTPLFHEEIDHVVLNPGWTPAEDALSDLLKREDESPGYLERRGFVRLERPGGRVGYRQQPGPSNALGRAAIRFPNENNIYLHGSPDPEDFEQAVRAFSRGCVRVEGIESLVSDLLAWDGAMTREEVAAALETGRTQRVSLQDPLPVHFEYVDVVVDDDGTVRFLRNLYRR